MYALSAILCCLKRILYTNNQLFTSANISQRRIKHNESNPHFHQSHLFVRFRAKCIRGFIKQWKVTNKLFISISLWISSARVRSDSRWRLISIGIGPLPTARSFLLSHRVADTLRSVLISVNLPFTVMRIEIGDSPLFPKRDLRIRKRIENVFRNSKTG